MSKNDENSDQQQEMENMEAVQNRDLATRARDEGFWREMLHQVRLVWYLLRDPDVPLYLKILPLAALLYIIIPTDFMPDVFPLVGQLDDITALIVGGKVFIEMAPPEIVARYMAAMRRHAPVTAAGDHDADQVPPSDKEVENSIIIEGESRPVDRQEG
jgi:uncharacterized membrane protein YkvA (DUF1232 family)